MPPSNSNQQGGQQGQQGPMGQMGSQGESGSQGQQGQQGQQGSQGQGGESGNSPLGELPPPPPDVVIGAASEQIGGPIGDLTGNDPNATTSEGEGGEQGEGKQAKSGGTPGGQNDKKITETDGQNVGGGGSQGSNRAKGTEVGEKMSTNL